MQLTGNLVNAYFICKRKFWLYARQINPDQEIDLLLLGRLISEESYYREKKEILFEGMKIDFVKMQEGEIFLLCEIKRSSKGLKAAIMQLAFYIKKLKEIGIYSKGEILIPKEKRRIPFELTEELEEELRKSLAEMKSIMFNDNPPAVFKTSFCKSCGFFEFCFA